MPNAGVGISKPFRDPNHENIYPCAVGGWFQCSAAGGPEPGKYTWEIGDDEYGPYGPYNDGKLNFQVTDPEAYTTSVTFRRDDGQGDASATGAWVHGIKAEPSVDGGASAYIDINGPRKQVLLGFEPSSIGDRHKVTLRPSTGLNVYLQEEDEYPMTGAPWIWDDFSLNNWPSRPSSVWVAATQIGELTLEFLYYMANLITPFGYYEAAEHSATVTLNYIQVDILQDEQVITNTTHDEIVGKKINLQCRVLPQGTPVTAYNWTIGGSVLSEFYVGPPVSDEHGNRVDGSQIPGEKRNLTVLNEQTVHYAWYVNGDGLVQVGSAQVGGAWFSAVATFNVKRPTSSLIATTGTVQVNQGTGEEQYLALRFGDVVEPVTPGITFRGTIEVPTGFSGEGCLVQLYTQDDRLRSADWPHTWNWHKGAEGLDRIFPYTGPFSASSVLSWMGVDSPDLELTASDDMAWANDSARVWLMFRPSGADVWVPLRMMGWRWSGTASKAGGPWALTGGSGHWDASVDTTTYPVWTRNRLQNVWEEGEPPP